MNRATSGCTHLLISDRRLRKTRVLSIVAAVPTCRHFQNRGSSKSLYLSRFSRCVHALAPCGRGCLREAKAGEGFHPRRNVYRRSQPLTAAEFVVASV